MPGWFRKINLSTARYVVVNVGDDIVVTISKETGNIVRATIQAPPDVRISMPSQEVKK